jgi:hypothetical protein
MGQVIRTDSDAAGQKAITITLNENKELIDEQLTVMQGLLTQARVLNIYKAHENDFIVDDRMFSENDSE